jgi:hypothetical protein
MSYAAILRLKKYLWPLMLSLKLSDLNENSSVWTISVKFTKSNLIKIGLPLSSYFLRMDRWTERLRPTGSRTRLKTSKRYDKVTVIYWWRVVGGSWRTEQKASTGKAHRSWFTWLSSVPPDERWGGSLPWNKLRSLYNDILQVSVSTSHFIRCYVSYDLFQGR